MPEISTEYIDHAITVAYRPRGLPRGVTHRLYQAARDVFGLPLSLHAPEGLLDRVAPGALVVLVTGTSAPPWLPYGELDGPPGATALARILAALGEAVPVVLCSAHHAPLIRGTLEAAEFVVTDLATARTRRFAAVVEGLSPTARMDARELLVHYMPSAVIAIGRLGPTRKGSCTASWGIRLTQADVDFGRLFISAARQGIDAVGIGDGGSEFGIRRDSERGPISPGVRPSLPLPVPGRECQGNLRYSFGRCRGLELGSACSRGHTQYLGRQTRLVPNPGVKRPYHHGVRPRGDADVASAEPGLDVDRIDRPNHKGMVALLGQIARTGLQERRRDF